MSRVLAIFFLMILGAIDLLAQAPHFQKYFLLKKNETVQVNVMFQSKAGFIWYGTNKGLFKFDGISLQQFTQRDSLPDDHVTALSEDSLGRLWIGSKNGRISFIDKNNGIVHFNPEEGNSPAEVSDILFDRVGNLWFATINDGLYYYTKNRLYRLDKDNGMPDLFIYDLVEDHKGNVWAATDGGVAVCQLQNNKVEINVINQENGLTDNIVKKLCLGEGHSVYMLTEDKGIFQYDPITEKCSSFIDATSIQGTITDFLVDDNKIWLSVSQIGVMVFDTITKEVKVYSNKAENTLSLVNKLLLDSEGNVWIGTKTGVLRCYADHLETLDAFGATENTNVLALAIDKQNNLWFSNGDGLFKRKIYDSGAAVLEQLAGTPFKSKTIISLYCDFQGFIWAGLYGEGLLRINPHTGKIVHFNKELRNGNILSITGRKNVVWIATLGGGTRIEINDDKFILKNYSQRDGLVSDFIYQVFEDSQNRVWFATDGKGIDMLDEKGFHHIAGETEGKVVFGFVEDGEKTIWANVQGEGLFKFDRQTFHPFNAVKLRDNNINSMGLDNAGNITVMHDAGLDVIDVKQKLLNYVSEEIGTNARIANLNAVVTDAHGRLYVGTDAGIVSFSERRGNAARPKPFIDRLKVMNKNIDSNDEMILNYDQNSITINYHGFWFQDPQELKFRYTLANYDHEWIESHDRSATYSSLPPGEYIFKLQASNTDTFKNSKETTFKFSIEPPFWKTKAFYAVILTLIGSAGYGYLKYRERSLVNAKHLLEKKVEERTQEIQIKNEEIQSQAEEIRGINENLEMIVRERTDELERKNKALEDSAFIIAHELRAPVASILGLINLISKSELSDEGKTIVSHMENSAEKLNLIVRSITKAIEKGDHTTHTRERDL